MNALPTRTLLVVTTVLLGSCGKADPKALGPTVPATPSSREEAMAVDGEREAVDSGRARILFIEHHLSRRGREGIERDHVSVTLPQLIGDEEGIPRINGLLRHLALDWPSLPETGRSSPEEAQEDFRALAERASRLRPADWPTRVQLETLEGLLPVDFFDPDGFYPSQEVASFSAWIVRRDTEKVVLRLEWNAVAVISRHYEAEITLDLHTGEAIGFAVVPLQEE